MTTPPAAAPAPLIARLARPTAAYRRRAWFALAGLALFVLLYFALAGWFLLTAYRLTIGADGSGKDAIWGWLVGACALFLAVFMLKAIFFVKHGGAEGHLELRPEQQPELFRFLHELADRAGAPRPHKVYVSAGVNAAVFYDLSMLNLFFASRKNLEIGLGLVNSLTLGEFQAVLAHEFGHFAQRAMAVGRWVYVAQQIAAHLVARRDKLDDFLRGLSNFDIRFAWVGWLLSLIVWSIRSLVESAFQVVVLMQRALSREMEMNADLVAVSLTGSDALVHALHRLQSADDAWGRAAAFVMNEKARGRLTRDLFTIQARVIQRMGQVLNDADWGSVPAPAGGVRPEEHRLFKAELAQPPQMWLTHPLNHEREANAKRHYVAAPIDPRSAWTVFSDAQALREQVTARLLGEAGKATPVGEDESLQALDRQFERESLKSRYRGAYFGRSIVRCAADPQALHEPLSLPGAAEFDRLYPEALAAQVESLRRLEKDVEQLRALQRGALTPTDGVIRYRGQALRRADLPRALQAAERELARLQGELQAHDRRCRSLHLAAAAGFGEGWPEYLRGLLAVLHYADHTEANLRDLQGLVANTVQVVTATRRVNAAGIERLVRDGNLLGNALEQVFADAGRVLPDPTLLQRLGAPSWADALGTLELRGGVNKDNVGEWIKVVDSWVDHAAGSCGALRGHALEQLLSSEAALAGHVRQRTRPGPAPAASQVPPSYSTLVAGAERKRQTQLGWWARFQTADGVVPAGARLLVAGGIVAAVLGLGGSVGSSSVTVYNGLARPVWVKIGPHGALQVAPFGTARQDIAAGAPLKVETRTVQGQLIERFEADVRGSFGQFIYNVAGASPMVEWTATYGNAAARPERMLGTPRWFSSSADVLFGDAPKSVRTKGGGATRDVLTALAADPPQQQLGVLAAPADQQRVAGTRARWDALDSRHAAHWLVLALAAPEHKDILAARLAESPDDVLLLRLEQDSADEAGRAAACQRHQARAAAAPQNPDLQYVALRCLPDGPAQDQAFIDGHGRYPQHGWFSYAAGYAEAGLSHWPQALAAYELARRQVPPLGDMVAVEMARIRRLLRQDSPAAMAELGRGSHALGVLLALESGQAGSSVPAMAAYPELAQGHLQRALQLVQGAQVQAQTRARVLRLAAASEGAGPELVAQALALPLDQGLDEATVWASLGLAARARQDLAGLRSVARQARPQEAEAVLRFMDALQAGQPLADAEPLLAGLPPELRGHGYSVGVILLRAKAPPAWRDAARRLLFASERPYFG
jgi:Zn-dependent protease with chaperone function